MLSKTVAEPRPMFISPTLRHVTGIALIVIGAIANNCHQSWGQSGKDTTTLKGSITSVERKGKTTKVTLKTDQEEHTFVLTDKVDLKITYEGDDEFLAAGLFVKADCTKDNGKYYTSDRTEVYLPNPSAQPRTLVVEIPKPRDKLGEQRYIVSGRIFKNFVPPDNTGGVSRSVNAGGFGRNVGHVELPYGTSSLFLEMRSSDSITVVFSDPTKLENDQQATATGRWSGKKFVPQSFLVKTGQKLRAAESLDELTGKKNKK